MPIKTNKEKIRFWRKWTLLNAIVLIIAYPVGYFIGSLLAESISEWGSHFEQTRDMIIFQVVAGFFIGITQWLLLRKFFQVSSYWIYSIPIVVIVVEVIAGIILWKLDINRGELSFIEGDPYSHALILAIVGLLAGVIQLPLLKNFFSGTFYWIVASMIAWALSVLVTAIGHQYDIAVLITFVIGSLLYGAITGATLMWVLQRN